MPKKPFTPAQRKELIRIVRRELNDAISCVLGQMSQERKPAIGFWHPSIEPNNDIADD